ASYWVPIILLGLHGYLEERRTRWLLLFGVAWILQSLCNGYMLLHSAVMIALWIVYFCSRRKTLRPGLAIAGAWAVAGLLLLPILLKYQHVHEAFGLHRTENEILAFSARLRSWGQVSGDAWFWGSRLPQGNDDLFPGATALIAVSIGVIAL